jgi:mono/diheme cytochrome c family protein
VSDHHKHAVRNYIIIALILGVLTYIEYAMIEYPEHPAFAWMSSGMILFWLIVLSFGKFLLVVAYFMHLREDNRLYTGFFSSGMVITLGTFIALSFMFTVRSVAIVQQEIEEPPVIAAIADLDVAHASHLYEHHCASCHRPDGAGYAGAIPPHAGHLPLVLQAEGGRAYLIDVVLYGLRGEIEVAGRRYDGVMPSRASLRDADIAKVLNYAVSAFNNELLLPDDFEPFRADEVAAARGRDLSPDDVHAQRLALDIPDVDTAVLAPSPLALASSLRNPPPKRQAAIPGPPAEAFEERERATIAIADIVVELEEVEEVDVEEAEVEEAPAAEEAETVEVEEAAEAAPDEAEETEAPVEAVAEVFDWDWQELGAQTYANCVACHQANGQGIPGVFPPLAGHMPELYNAQGGREFIIEVLLYGLQGPITVHGQNYNGVMPGFAYLSDEQIAAVLNYTLTQWGNAEELEDFVPLVPDEVAALRGQGISASEMLQRREALELE